MITEERISTFINSFDIGNTPFLNELEQYAIKTNVPVIRPQMQSFLKLLLAMKQPKQILEVGTAIGFSALLMSEYGPKDCSITTIEKYEKGRKGRTDYIAGGRCNRDSEESCRAL